MNSVSRIITGILLTLAGVGLIIVTFLLEKYSYLVLGILSLIFGLIIFFNKREDKIESDKGEANSAGSSTNKKIIVTTMNDLPGRKVKEILGVVRGNTVRSRNIGRDIMAGFKSIVGGEIGTFTELISQSRDEAINRMVNHAIEMGADAVIAIRFDSSSVMKNSSEILAYGTAVKLG